jgi:hypothetical protein
MDGRKRLAHVARLAALTVLPLLAGCANLVVKKVPVAQREAGKDGCKEGFRYYLNRPYLVVKTPILIAERKTLVERNGDYLYPLDPAAGGPERIDAVRVSQGDGTFRPVTPAELERIKAVLAGRRTGERRDTTRDEAVEPAAGQVIINTPDASVQAGAPEALPMSTAQAPGGAGSTGAKTDSGAAASTATDTASLTGYDIIDPAKLPKDTTLTGNMEVLYLPDLDEQYVVKSKNLLAKSAFALTFVNGSELTQVQGEHDATTVTVALLNQIQNIIGAAAQTAQQQSGQKSSTTTGHQASGPARAPDTRSPSAQSNGRLVPPDDVYQKTERVFIRPGVYRLNKPWEVRQPGYDPPTGLGLLAKIGLPHVSDVTFDKVSSLTNGL